MRKMMVVIGILTLLATACAKKEAPSSSGSPPVSLSGTVNNHGTKDVSSGGMTLSLSIEQDNFYFDPTFIKAVPGATVKVALKNEGKSAHTFTIDGLGVDKELQPDGTADVTFTLPASGVMNFYCRFHRSSGMQGAFFFSTGASAPPAGSPASSGSGYYHS